MTLQLVVLLAATSLLSGCATSDTNMETETDTVGTVPEMENPANPDKTHDTEMYPPDSVGQATVSASNPIGREQNIVALLQSDPNMSTLVKLIRAADMITVLESPATYTLFAPNNAAFAALPAGTLEALERPDNKLELTRLLQAHLIPNRVMSYELKDNMQMSTAQGEAVPVQVDERGIVVGGAQVLTPDIKASNGVVHIIDKVLVPKE
ncbi:fasciclin domain-containing protein [Pontibacter chitinilyticus]|uniref:fasciclin domain-containing protein n=1 Tax=Pontibacter chitinilyticus TaxID=2674989 RepID=UPI003219639C